MKFRKNKSDDRYDDKYDRDEDRTLTEDILDFVKVFAISAIAILLFVNIVAHPVTVMGRSMDPTLANGEYGFTNLLDLAINGVNRGDVVVLDMEEVDGNRSYWVKRVIGLPGETIECKNGQVYIDGVALDESAYLDEQFMEDSLKDYVDTFGLNMKQATSLLTLNPSLWEKTNTGSWETTECTPRTPAIPM